MSIKLKSKNIVNDAIVKDIAQAVDSLEYGTVTVKVHDKKIIQVEVAERKRFEDVWRIEEGGGI
ncbi:MAG: YezD family protein [Candidatus Omnitrophica bacterium]|nr:YezD family protein [Candidatus Omnitrophota bacterium]